MNKKLIPLLTLSLLFGMSTPSMAGDKAGFDDYVKSIQAEARESGISEQIVADAFKGVEFKPKAVVADKNQPEKKLTLDEYLVKAVPNWKVQQANKYYKQNREDLERIGKEYGVQPRYIVALWGVESNFGKFTGNYNVISALTTMAYDGRREAFFKKETLAALKILDDGHISIANMKGSWAGAMGQCQFMPSSFLSYAADGNGDGKKDIWKTKADVFASTANYLKQFGWDDEYTWGRQVKLPASFKHELQGRDDEKGKFIQDWANLGVTRFDGSPLPKLENDIKAWIIEPDSNNGSVYLIYNNYNVLMKWNRSFYFASAVSRLADQIQTY